MNAWEEVIHALWLKLQPKVTGLSVANDYDAVIDIIGELVDQYVDDASFLKLAELVWVMDMGGMPIEKVYPEMTPQDVIADVVISELSEVLFNRVKEGFEAFED